MPELARFLGIVIGIFPREHPPPHFHAVYGEYRWSKKMIPKVIAAKYEHDYTVHVLFSDGTEGDVDMTQELYGEMFDPLTFKQFTIHPEFHTLCWPNGADIAPEFLYEKVKVPA